MPAAFPILAREQLMRAAQHVVESFDNGGKRNKAQKLAQEFIGEPLASAATAKGTPQLVTALDTFNGNYRDGRMTVVKSKGQFFTFHEKQIGGKLELRCYMPLSKDEFDLDKLRQGGVTWLYGKKNGADVPRITFDVGARSIETYIMGELQRDVPHEWARGVAESALALIGR